MIFYKLCPSSFANSATDMGILWFSKHFNEQLFLLFSFEKNTSTNLVVKVYNYGMKNMFVIILMNLWHRPNSGPSMFNISNVKATSRHVLRKLQLMCKRGHSNNSRHFFGTFPILKILSLILPSNSGWKVMIERAR